MDAAADHDRLAALRAYAEGRLGTRRAIERLGARDYADLVIALTGSICRSRPPRRTTRHRWRGHGRSSNRCCVMAVEVRIIVSDAPPLIILAVAKSLDYLLYPLLPVIIPDAVFYEATGAAGKLGAEEILEWYRAHIELVRIEPTEIFQDEMTLRELEGRRPARDLGERAAIEVIRTLPLGDNERVLLLSDDRDAERLVIVDPDRLILLTTWDYLRQLEEARRIQSADAVIAAVREAGRTPPQRDLWSGHDPEIREAVKAILSRSR